LTRRSALTKVRIQAAFPFRRAPAMYKLITILVAAIPVIVFLKTMFFRKSKVLQEATSAFRKQVDYLFWGILFLVGCALLYSTGILIHSIWK
jgi:hypothetical protein